MDNIHKPSVLKDREFWFIVSVIAGFFLLALIGVGIEEYFDLNQPKPKVYAV